LKNWLVGGEIIKIINILNSPSKKTETCEFIMNNKKTVNVRELDVSGRYKMIGWSLPSGVLDGLLENINLVESFTRKVK